jgi:hypothetical protein
MGGAIIDDCSEATVDLGRCTMHHISLISLDGVRLVEMPTIYGIPSKVDRVRRWVDLIKRNGARSTACASNDIRTCKVL